MTDKLTDSEIVKAQEYCCEVDGCNRGCPLVDKCESPIKTMEEFIKFDLDLINRQKAENKSQSIMIKMLKSSIEDYKNSYINQKAEIERLKESLNIELENFATEYDNKIKAEAYKEFAERLKEQAEVYTDSAEDVFILAVGISKIDNLLKELMGENND